MNLRVCLGLLLAFTSGCAAQQCGTGPCGAVTTITNVTLIDGTGGSARSGMDIEITGSRISALRPSGQATPRGTVIDATGRYALPGLWDMHLHLGRYAHDVIPLLLDAGVTSVRDMGDGCANLLSLRDSIRQGWLAGPRMLVATRILESPEELASHARIRRAADSLGLPPMPGSEPDCPRIAVAGAGEADSAVAAVVAAGGDFVKARSYADSATYVAIVAAARRHGLRFAGHPPYAVPAPAAMLPGVASFEHGFYPWPPNALDSATNAAMLATMRANGIALVPTLVTWEPRALPYDSVLAEVTDSTGGHGPRRTRLPRSLLEPWLGNLGPRRLDTRTDLAGWREVLDRHMQQVGAFHRAGIRVMPGTDAPLSPLVYPGASVVDELELFVRGAGFSPMEAIESATRLPAEAMGMADSLGTITTGRLADLILVGEDPLSNIGNLHDVRLVIANGKVVSRRGE